MLSKYKWYVVRFPVPLLEVFRRLDAYRSKDSQVRRFVTDVDNLSFEFFWQTLIYATSIDDDGVEQRSEVFSVNRQKVDIVGEDKMLFRLKDPPRSSKELLNTLEDLLGFGFVCQPFIVTDEIVLEAISEFSPVILNSVKLSGGIPKMTAVARLELASKLGLDREQIDNFGLQGVAVESASYLVRHKGISGQVGFSRTGMCKISGDLSPLIRARIEECVLGAVR